jgi:Fe-S oxidoreductase
MALEDYRADAMRCTRCSYCKWIPFDLVKSARFAKGCPSVDHNDFHSYSAGGRLITYLSLLDSRSEVTGRVVDIVFKCQLCGNCDVTCKVCRYDMEPLAALHEFRFRMVEQGHVPPEYGPIIERFRTRGTMVAEGNAARDRWAEGLGLTDLTTEKAEVAFHPGCRHSYDGGLAPVARTSVDILRKAGVDFGVAGAGSCCGGRVYHMGYAYDFAGAARHTIEAWATAGVRTVVTPCADCCHTFKRLYPEVGSDVEVLHMVEFVDRLIKEGRMTFTKEVPLTVTYHDPCHLGRQGEPHVPWQGKEKKIFGQAVVYDPPRPRYIGAYGIYDAPRDVLAAIPGVQLVEMERNREAAWCCGAGGGAKDAFPEFSAWTAAERIAEARTTGADALVTACPWCERNFIDALRGDSSPMQVLDVIELVGRAL